jgi:hypothetical protein
MQFRFINDLRLIAQGEARECFTAINAFRT